MNIAVLISGEYREFEIAHRSWDFDKCGKVDYYFSTWSETSEVNENLNINIHETVTAERIYKFLPVRNCVISEPNELFNQQKMINRWQEGLKLIKNSDLKYDAIVIVRPDLYLEYGESLPNFISNLQPDTIYCYCDIYREKHLNIIDQIFIGNSDSIFKLLDIDYESSDLCPTTNIHEFLTDWFTVLYKSVVPLPFKKYYIVRSNSRELNHYSYNIIKTNSEFWYQQKHLQETVIAEFKGFSGSTITLIENSFSKKFVRKQNHVQRNYDKMSLLAEQEYSVPKIIRMQDDVLDMEYIPGIDIKTFLLRNDVKILADFIIQTIDRFKLSSMSKNYSDTYLTELGKIDYTHLPFTMHDLFFRLPKDLPSSVCHGDFTLENLIYGNGKFYMIDTVTGPYDSWVFDIAKMRQDIDGHWFLRDTNTEVTVQLKTLRDRLHSAFSRAFSDYLYILMLLRVYKHCTVNTKEHNLILQEIKRLWK